MAPRKRPTDGRMRSRKRVSYKEDLSSSDHPDEKTEEASEDSNSKSGSVNPRASRVSMYATRHSTKKHPPSRINRSMPLKKISDRVETIRDLEDEHPVLRLGGKVPRWQELPYHILTQIFCYAFHPLPLVDDMHKGSINWLLQTARLCRSFMEPALSALYYSPPVYPPRRVQRLIAHLASQTENSTLNYRAKIKYFDIDPVCLAANLKELISLTPQLRGLRVTCYRLTSVISTGVFPQSFFPNLQNHRILLQEWTWNSIFMGSKTPALKLFDIHSLQSFRSLRSLSFMYYDELKCCEEEMARAINALPQLKRLSFNASPIVNQILLPLLPKQLELFELVNCSSVTSEILSLFLASHGQNIRQLILDHNRSLNLSFLSKLAVTCPKAEYIRINLRFYNTYFTFKSLLFLNETPTWPTSLQQLELFHLRKWDLNIAEMFFSSLVDSAASLSDLRQLDIKASLEESGWRERVIFRDRWIARLRDVFLRVSPPANPYFCSISAFKQNKHQTKDSKTKLSDKETMLPKLALRAKRLRRHSNKFRHIEVNAENISNCDRSNCSETETLQPGQRRSKRIKLQVDNDQYIPPPPSTPPRRYVHQTKESSSSSGSEDSAIHDSVEKDFNDNNSNGGGGGKQDFHVQGMCDIVNVLIDNLRPTKHHFDEGDFLDDEVSGDEDWNGDDSHVGEGPYAW